MTNDTSAAGRIKSIGYAQSPEWPGLVSDSASADDVFGVVDRLRAIKSVLANRNLGEIVDLGGHNGFFPMSLMNAGLAQSAVVYDADADLMKLGRSQAAALGIDNRIKFVTSEIDLEFVKRLEPVDTVICLNLIHHAGDSFDIPAVDRLGWERYAEEWLTELRKKSKVLIFGVGLKRAKPRNWNVGLRERPVRLTELMRSSGWTLLYDANVDDIRRLGVEKAAGRLTRSRGVALTNAFLMRLRNLSRRMIGIKRDKLQDYYLYILA